MLPLPAVYLSDSKGTPVNETAESDMDVPEAPSVSTAANKCRRHEPLQASVPRARRAARAKSNCPARPGLCRHRLTPSEIDIILLVATGLTDDAIASVSYLSPHTVRHHMASAMRRAGAHSRTELIAKCFAAGVLALAWPPTIADDRCICAIASGV